MADAPQPPAEPAQEFTTPEQDGRHISGFPSSAVHGGPQPDQPQAPEADAAAPAPVDAPPAAPEITPELEQHLIAQLPKKFQLKTYAASIAAFNKSNENLQQLVSRGEHKDGAADKADAAPVQTYGDPFADWAATKGVDPELALTRFAETGSVDPADAEKLGMTVEAANEFVKNKVEGQKAVFATIRQAGVQAAGGEEALTQLQQSARQAIESGALTDAQAKWYDNAVDGPNATPESAEAAVSWLKGKLGQAAGQPQPRTEPIAGQSAPRSVESSKPFETMQQMDEAMRDPRYEKFLPMGGKNPKFDPEYQKSVLERSSALIGVR